LPLGPQSTFCGRGGKNDAGFGEIGPLYGQEEQFRAGGTTPGRGFATNGHWKDGRPLEECARRRTLS
jgi:hypothetical protein